MQNKLPDGIRVLFVAGFGPVVADPDASGKLYRKVLGLPLRHEEGYEGYWHSQCLEGVKHFALWPLEKAARSCFGEEVWPERLPVPQSWLELDVEDIVSATRILEQNGYELLLRLKEEPWGQTVTRFLSPEGILMAVTHTPFLREAASAEETA